MKQETGFDLLKLLPKQFLHIVFVTAHDEYGIQAIKFSATDYLLKPVVPEELIAAVHKVILSNKNSYTDQTSSSGLIHRRELHWQIRTKSGMCS